MSDDILYVVEHIEAELQRLGRLVATLRRRVEAQQAQLTQQAVHGDVTGTTTSTVSGPAPNPTPMPASAMRTVTRSAGSMKRLPAVIEETDEDAMVRTTGGGSSYGFVRDRRREDEPASEPRGLHDDSALDRRTR